MNKMIKVATTAVNDVKKALKAANAVVIEVYISQDGVGYSEVHFRTGR